MPSKVWDEITYEITYPFPNFNGCTVEGWEWISDIKRSLNVSLTFNNQQNSNIFSAANVTIDPGI